jgi:cyclopropane fatty-acyl-phospholipid synthase-like methyltransferase
MRTPYPSPDDYRIIYARYYQGRSVEELCGHLGSVKDMHCLDLCSGEGLATEYFLRHGASLVWSVDESALMAAEVEKRCPQAHVIGAPIETALMNAWKSWNKFYCVVCRQGINYWLNPYAVELLAECMKTGSLFVFNTLNQKPSTEPKARKYTINGRAYAEIAYSVGNVIHTVVACEGYEPHQSEILWLSRELLHEILEPHFSVTEYIVGNSSVYVCTKT